MDNYYIPRTLWYKKRDANNQEETIEISEDQLLLETRPLIVLGEAGMGKTELMKRLGNRNGYTHCTAKKLLLIDLKSIYKDGTTLVIDALDEATSQHDRDAISQVLKKLAALGFPRFILSCRVAEWHSFTNNSTIRDVGYDQEPLEVHLQPFSEEEIHSFLANRLGAPRATEVNAHFEQLGLVDWLGNPQTLDLICSVATKSALPQNRAELFAMATEKLATEHNGAKTNQQLPVARLLSAAGAACAALILCGKQSIVRKPRAWLEEDELLLQDVEQLPHGSEIASALNTKLFIAHGADQFGYMHRRIGEYLAAKWLLQQADTDRKRRRLLAMFQYLGMVPASLRGLYAWLADDLNLAQQVIAFDPIAILEYGDADAMELRTARALLQGLERFAHEHPTAWPSRPLRARCLSHPELQECITRLLSLSNTNTPGWLRVVLMESIAGTAMVQPLMHVLRSILEAPEQSHQVRLTAFETIAPHLMPSDVEKLLSLIDQQKSRSSGGLALQMAHHYGVERLDATQLAQCAFAEAVQPSIFSGNLYFLRRKLPTQQLPPFLDTLAGLISNPTTDLVDVSGHNLTEFAFFLIARALQESNVCAEQILRWLQPLSEIYASEPERQQVAQLLQTNTALRQAVQQVWLLPVQDPESLREQCYELQRHSEGLRLTEQDITVLLHALDDGDNRWKMLLQLTSHGPEHGAAARLAAQRFANAIEDKDWVKALVQPQPPAPWQIEQEQHRKAREEEQAQKKAEDIAALKANLHLIGAGEWNWCWQLARGYLYRLPHPDEDLPPHQRIAHALLPEIANAAHTGFEAFLTASNPSPTAAEIATSYAEDRAFNSRFILIAALQERLRHGRDLQDLSTDRLQAAFFILQSGEFQKHSGCDTQALHQQLVTELTQRGQLHASVDLLYTQQVQAAKPSVYGLEQLLKTPSFSPICEVLVPQWLRTVPEMDAAIECLLIDYLLRSDEIDTLQDIAKQRLNTPIPQERRTTWLVVEFIVSGEHAALIHLGTEAIAPDLIWEIRARSQASYRGQSFRLIWNAAHIQWIVSTFRQLWPWVSDSDDGWREVRNTWNACRFLSGILEKLANTTTPEAIAALQALRDAPQDSYTELLQTLCTQQLRKLCEQNYVPASLEALQSIAHDAAPNSIEDLQAWVIEELRVVQTKIRANDVDSWRGFFDDKGTPYGEERCRDHLLELLRQGAKEVTYTPEAHVAGDKEVDITCSVGALRLPIEIKGQWHREVWTAADTQLVPQYTTDWQARNHGIYLVLWFGEQQGNKALKPLGKGQPVPRSADEMHTMLTARSVAAQSGKVKVVVLDIQLPATAQPALRNAEPHAQAI